MVTPPARVLVTGSSGFVGSHVTTAMMRAGFSVVGLDLSPQIDAAQPDEYIRCDVTDSESLAQAIADLAPTAIVHGAAITPGEDEREIAELVRRVNQDSTRTALVAAADVGCRRFILLSSAGVYSDPAPGEMLNENSPVAESGGLYARTKLASERLCRWADQELGLSTISLRIGPVYGEFERPTASRSRMSPIFQTIALAADGETIRCNSPDTVYDWIHGDDVGRAIIAALGAPEPNSIYNVAGPRITMADTMRVIQSGIPALHCEWLKVSSHVNLPIPERSRPISSELIRSDLGFEPMIALPEGVQRVIASHISR